MTAKNVWTLPNVLWGIKMDPPVENDWNRGVESGNLSKEVTRKQRLQWSEDPNYMNIWGKDIPGKEKSKNRYGFLGKDRNFGLCSKCHSGASGRFCAGWWHNLIYILKGSLVAAVGRIDFRRYGGEIRDQLGGCCSGSGDRQWWLRPSDSTWGGEKQLHLVILKRWSW